MNLLKKYYHDFSNQHSDLSTDIGLLVLRIGVGLMMAFSHGLGKMQRFFSGEPIQFLDPIGIGAEASLFLAGFAEFFCALALTMGFLTRIMSVPLAFTMGVAVFVVHAADPFQKQEFGLLYLVTFLTLLLTGPGRFSIDCWISSRLKK